MSLYNMIMGVNPTFPFLVSMLFEKHAEGLPRFRDVFFDTGEGEPKFDFPIILIYTRVGGGNRNEGYGEEVFYKHPCFVTTYDDDFDSTFGNYVFRVPPEFSDDYTKVKEGRVQDISSNLRERCRRIYPKLEEKLWVPLWGPVDEKAGITNG